MTILTATPKDDAVFRAVSRKLLRLYHLQLSLAAQDQAARRARNAPKGSALETLERRGIYLAARAGELEELTAWAEGRLWP